MPLAIWTSIMASTVFFTDAAFLALLFFCLRRVVPVGTVVVATDVRCDGTIPVPMGRLGSVVGGGVAIFFSDILVLDEEVVGR